MWRFVNFYERCLARYPRVTKASLGGGLAATGDYAAQRIEGCDSVDRHRFVSFTSFGVLWTGLFNHYWYGWLARRVPGAAVGAVIQKALWQHAFLNPFVYLPFFYCYQGATLQLSLDEATAKAKAEYIPTITRLWSIWIPTALVMFRFVPERHQVLLTAGVNFLWNTVLSLTYNS